MQLATGLGHRDTSARQPDSGVDQPDSGVEQPDTSVGQVKQLSSRTKNKFPQKFLN